MQLKLFYTEPPMLILFLRSTAWALIEGQYSNKERVCCALPSADWAATKGPHSTLASLVKGKQEVFEEGDLTPGRISNPWRNWVFLLCWREGTVKGDTRIALKYPAVLSCGTQVSSVLWPMERPGMGSRVSQIPTQNKAKPSNNRATENMNFIYFFFWPCHVVFGILVPRPGIEPGPQQWKYGVLTTGPPGNSPKMNI